MIDMGKLKLSREEKRVRRRMKRRDKKLCRNEIKAQRRAKLGAVIAAIGLVGLFVSRKK